MYLNFQPFISLENLWDLVQSVSRLLMGLQTFCGIKSLACQQHVFLTWGWKCLAATPLYPYRSLNRSLFLLINWISISYALYPFRCASIDGDADRLVYFYIPSSPHGGSTSPTPPIFLLDGDKIATLFASFIIDQLQTITRVQNSAPEATAHKALIPGFGDVRVAVIQTAYANGASTNYIKQVLGLEVAVTSTGVKYLHKKAAQYDVGIYFEANGHGTILFSDNFTRWLQEVVTEGRGEPSFSFSLNAAHNFSIPKHLACKCGELTGIMFHSRPCLPTLNRNYCILFGFC